MNKLLIIQNILRDFFDRDDIVVTGETCASDIEGWDSLANVQIMISIELKFGTEFSMDELASFSNIQDIIDNLESKDL